MPEMIPLKAQRPRRAGSRSSVHISEDDIDRAEDRDRVRHESVLQQPRKYLQVDERGSPHLRAERVRAATVADHVDPDLTLRALDRVVSLAARALPHVAESRPHRAS